MTFCSLINKTRQSIEPLTYTELRFGGGTAGESSDHDHWHENTDTTKRASGLIIPTVTGVGMLWAKIGWQDPVRVAAELGGKAPTKFYAKFVRDPWTTREDQTGAQHFAPVPGGQNHITSWVGVLRDGQPLAVMVMHNGDQPLDVVLAEYKAWVP